LQDTTVTYIFDISPTKLDWINVPAEVEPTSKGGMWQFPTLFVELQHSLRYPFFGLVSRECRHRWHRASGSKRHTGRTKMKRAELGKTAVVATLTILASASLAV
jgi:hypothetical protein